MFLFLLNPCFRFLFCQILKNTILCFERKTSSLSLLKNHCVKDGEKNHFIMLMNWCSTFLQKSFYMCSLCIVFFTKMFSRCTKIKFTVYKIYAHCFTNQIYMKRFRNLMKIPDLKVVLWWLWVNNFSCVDTMKIQLGLLLNLYRGFTLLTSGKIVLNGGKFWA